MKNKGVEEQVDWNECLIFDGDEQKLPAGSKTMLKGFTVKKLVRGYEVLDVESEQGFKVVKVPAPDDVIIGVQINENAVKAIKRTYGPNYATFRRADSIDGRYLNREEWEKATRPEDPTEGEFGYDVLKLEAIRQLRKQIQDDGKFKGIDIDPSPSGNIRLYVIKW